MNRKLILVQALLVSMVVALVAGPMVATGSASGSTNAVANTPAGAGPQGSVQANSPGSPLVSVGSGFTYQGQLKASGNPANGQYDFTFALYDALSGGTQVGSTVTVSGTAGAVAPSPYTSFIADTLHFVGNGELIINNDTTKSSVPIPTALKVQTNGKLALSR